MGELKQWVLNIFDWLIGLVLGGYQKSELPGKYWLYQRAKLKFGRTLIRHKMGRNKFWVPLDQWCFWLEKGPQNYYLDEFLPFCDQINGLPGNVTFIDLGADIGVVSALVASRCNNVNTLLCVEPNPNSYEILAKNISQIPLSAEAIMCAVSDFNGTADLKFNNALGSDHEGYIVKGEHGSTSVSTVDTLVGNLNKEAQKKLVIKVDVEGQEVNVFKGAKESISRADNVLVLLEIHPEVLERDGMTPEDLFSAAESIRGFKWTIPAKQGVVIERERSLFEQVEKRQYDIIGEAL